MGRSPGGHRGCTGSQEPSLEREFDAESDSVKNLGDLVRGGNYTPKTLFCSEHGFPLTISWVLTPYLHSKTDSESSSPVVKTPVCPWGAVHWIKWPFFFRSEPSPWQVRCFWPPPGDCKHDLEWSLGGLVTKQVRGDICDKKLSSTSEYSPPHDCTI